MLAIHVSLEVFSPCESSICWLICVLTVVQRAVVAFFEMSFFNMALKMSKLQGACACAPLYLTVVWLRLWTDLRATIFNICEVFDNFFRLNLHQSMMLVVRKIRWTLEGHSINASG
jgi:hypothetical protein